MNNSSKRNHAPKSNTNTYWLYGIHPCHHALANPSRIINEAIFTQKHADVFAKLCEDRNIPYAISSNDHIRKICETDANHQGITLKVKTLSNPSKKKLIESKRVAALDQLTDPHNVGAVIRSAAAFGIEAIIMPKDYSPSESAVLAKTACGMLDAVPIYRVTNLARSLAELKEHQHWVIGLDSHASQPIGELDMQDSALTIVLGAEGKGLRPLIRKHCDVLTHLPMQPIAESLNVSNAAAVCFYHFSKR